MLLNNLIFSIIHTKGHCSLTFNVSIKLSSSSVISEVIDKTIFSIHHLQLMIHFILCSPQYPLYFQDVLNMRLDKRVDAMLEQGLLSEIRAFHNEHNVDNRYVLYSVQWSCIYT